MPLPYILYDSTPYPSAAAGSRHTQLPCICARSYMKEYAGKHARRPTSRRIIIQNQGHCIKTQIYLSKPIKLSLNLLRGNQGMNLLNDPYNGYKNKMTSSDKFFLKVEFSSLTAAGDRFVYLHSVRSQIPQCIYDVTFLQSESTMTCLKNENVVQH